MKLAFGITVIVAFLLIGFLQALPAIQLFKKIKHDESDENSNNEKEP